MGTTISETDPAWPRSATASPAAWNEEVSAGVRSVGWGITARIRSPRDSGSVPPSRTRVSERAATSAAIARCSGDLSRSSPGSLLAANRRRRAVSRLVAAAWSVGSESAMATVRGRRPLPVGHAQQGVDAGGDQRGVGAGGGEGSHVEVRRR